MDGLSNEWAHTLTLLVLRVQLVPENSIVAILFAEITRSITDMSSGACKQPFMGRGRIILFNVLVASRRFSHEI